MTTEYQLGSIGDKSVVLEDLYVVSSKATVGSGAVDNWEFMAKKNGSTDLISAAKTTNGAELAADTEYALGIDQNQDCAPNTTLQVDVTKNGSPTDLSDARLVFGWKGRIDVDEA